LTSDDDPESRTPTLELDPADVPGDARSPESRIVRSLADKLLEVHAMLERECHEARSFRIRLEARLDSELAQLHEKVGELRQQLRDHEARIARLEAR
jgi:hypothetical protein